MSEVDNSSLEWTLVFEPDADAEEELANEEETVDEVLITDETIRQCRIIASLRTIEYGEVQTAPDQTNPAALLAIDFVFHPFQSRVKEAQVELAFDNKTTIFILQPDSIDDSESEEIIRHKLYGEFSFGYPPAGVDAKAGTERETEKKKKFALRIRGSGNHTSRATWTLKENPEARGGIHLNFMAVVILKVEGEMELDVEIRAKIGCTVKNLLGIRKIIARQTKKFDGKSALGRRPEALEIKESLFRVKENKTGHGA